MFLESEMSDIVKVNVQIDYHKIRGRLSKLFQDEKLRLQMHELLYKMCDPYVPMQGGVLSQASVEITKDHVRYNTPYAHYQYMGILYLTLDGRSWARKGEKKYPTDRQLVHSKEMHPRATAKWDQAMMREKGASFTKQVKTLVRRRAKELYG